MVELMKDEGFDNFAMFQSFVWGHVKVCPLTSQQGF